MSAPTLTFPSVEVSREAPAFTTCWTLSWHRSMHCPMPNVTWRPQKFCAGFWTASPETDVVAYQVMFGPPDNPRRKTLTVTGTKADVPAGHVPLAEPVTKFPLASEHST